MPVQIAIFTSEQHDKIISHFQKKWAPEGRSQLNKQITILKIIEEFGKQNDVFKGSA